MRSPCRDSLPEPPQTWSDIPLGPGQEDRPVGHLQHTLQGDPLFGTDTRRAPGYEQIPVVHRPPQSSA